MAAVPAAVLVIGSGAIPAHDAAAAARRLGPVIGFLAAVLVLAQLCDDEGLFRACGAWMARASAGQPRRLLALVFAVAAMTTAVLSLDATVVLLTPVVFTTAARLEARARPHLYPDEDRIAVGHGDQPPSACSAAARRSSPGGCTRNRRHLAGHR